MSFNATKKHALDKSRNINSRRVNVRSCIQICLYYRGNIGYTAIVKNYTKTENLNNDNLTNENIENIIQDLSELKEKSKVIQQEFDKYRKIAKNKGNRKLSNIDLIKQKENWDKIHQIWKKFEV
jgi:hypothetical protein